uniref:Uncharacterized protein n=1 Tax=Arundo donax TaxID=35708 RepID=A0A0A9EF15_ARUDO
MVSRGKLFRLYFLLFVLLFCLFHLVC